jgi:hypothetical protein
LTNCSFTATTQTENLHNKSISWMKNIEIAS